MLSIYVPVYDAEPWLERLLRSLLALPEDRFELVFVDDCSTDDSRARIEAAVAGRANVQVLAHSQNRGEGGASNTGIAAARGRWIMRCDADDEVDPRGLIEALTLAEAQDAEVLFAVCEMFQGSELIYRRVPRPFEGSLAAMAWASLLSTLHATLVRADLARRPGLSFRPMPFGCDTIWLIECLQAADPTRCVRTELRTYLYHRREGSASNPERDRAQRAKHVDRVLAFEAEKEKLGAALLERGELTAEAFAAGMIDQGRRIMRDLRKSGQSSRSVAYYRDRSLRFGATREMRRELLRALPLGASGWFTRLDRA